MGTTWVSNIKGNVDEGQCKFWVSGRYYFNVSVSYKLVYYAGYCSRHERKATYILYPKSWSNLFNGSEFKIILCMNFTPL